MRVFALTLVVTLAMLVIRPDIPQQHDHCAGLLPGDQITVSGLAAVRSWSSLFVVDDIDQLTPCRICHRHGRDRATHTDLLPAFTCMPRVLRRAHLCRRFAAGRLSLVPISVAPFEVSVET
jgi:hypothetical protein